MNRAQLLKATFDPYAPNCNLGLWRELCSATLPYRECNQESICSATDDEVKLFYLLCDAADEYTVREIVTAHDSCGFAVALANKHALYDPNTDGWMIYMSETEKRMFALLCFEARL